MRYQAIRKVNIYIFMAILMKEIFGVNIFNPNHKVKKSFVGTARKMATRTLNVISCKIKKI